MTIPAATAPTSSLRSPRVAYLLAFCLLGVCLSMAGPAMTHLRSNAGVGISAGGVILAGMGIGYVGASLVFGHRLDHRGAGHQALLRATGLAVVAAAALQVADALWAVTLVFAVIGACGGALDVMCNTLLVWHEPPERVGSSLNALHLRFGLGAIAAPLLVSVSLQVRDDLLLVTAAMALAVAGIAFLLHGVPTPQRVVIPDAEPLPHHGSPTLLILGALFFAVYVGAEGTFGAWSTTYGEDLSLGFASAAQVLTAVYWGGFTLGRLVAVAATKTGSVDRVLTASCAAATVASVALTLVDGRAIPTWALVAGLGFTLGPQYATMLAVVDRRVGLDGKATSRLIGAAGTGGLVIPLITGGILDAAGVRTLPLVVAVACAVAWALSVAVVARHPMPTPN